LSVLTLGAEDGGTFNPGTSVVHFDMDIHRYSAKITQLTGSLWWLLQNTMFDPVLPLWAEDHRREYLDGAKPVRRTIAGNASRLTDDRRDKIEHHDSVDVWVDHPAGRTSVKVNYWVIKDRDDGSKSGLDAYVDPHRPIAFTLFGQLHGTDDKREIAERLHLPNLAASLVVQIELDALSAAGKRDLLSTTRDRLKQGPFYDALRARIWEALADDEDLARIDQERKERMLARHSDKDRDKIRERFARLLERFNAGKDATASGKGGDERGRKPKSPGSRQPLEPLPTKKEPSFIRIANTQKPMLVRLNRSALVRLESDAPDGYLESHAHATLVLNCDPEGLISTESRSDFRGGRARISVRPGKLAKTGDRGQLTVFLITSQKQTFTSKIAVRIEDEEDASTSGGEGRAKVQVPETIAVSRSGDPPTWKDISRTSQQNWTESTVAEVRAGEKDTQIYVNMDGQHIGKLLRAAGYQQTGLKRMKNNYLLYVGFYAYAQHVAAKRASFESKELDEYKQGELDRVAQTVVHAISAAGRLEGDED
jgi:hypothetical protein